MASAKNKVSIFQSLRGAVRRLEVAEVRTVLDQIQDGIFDIGEYQVCRRDFFLPLKIRVDDSKTEKLPARDNVDHQDQTFGAFKHLSELFAGSGTSPRSLCHQRLRLRLRQYPDTHFYVRRLRH